MEASKDGRRFASQDDRDEILSAASHSNGLGFSDGGSIFFSKSMLTAGDEDWHCLPSFCLL